MWTYFQKAFSEIAKEFAVSPSSIHYIIKHRDRLQAAIIFVIFICCFCFIIPAGFCFRWKSRFFLKILFRLRYVVVYCIKREYKAEFGWSQVIFLVWTQFCTVLYVFNFALLFVLPSIFNTRASTVLKIRKDGGNNQNLRLFMSRHQESPALDCPAVVNWPFISDRFCLICNTLDV